MLRFVAVVLAVALAGMPRAAPAAAGPPAKVLRYAVSTAGLLFTLEDAVITIRFRDLENRSAIEPWEDTSTVIGNQQGTEALGPGREIRFALTLNLRN